MNDFAELARIVTNFVSKKVDLLSDSQSTASKKFGKIAIALSENPNLDEEEAEKIIGASRSSSSYRMFKLRFKERLLNSLLIADIDFTTQYSKAIVSLEKNVLCIKLLLLLSARSTAMELAEQTLKKAIEFQLWDVAMYCSMILCRHQSHTGNMEKFMYYNKSYITFSDFQLAENKSIVFYDSFMMQFANSLTFKMENLEEWKSQVKEIEALRKTYDTYQLGLHYYRLKGIYSFICQDYLASVKDWDAMADFLEAYKHFEYDTRLGEILLHKMSCFLYLHDYNNGLDCAEQCSALFKPGTNNWFLYNELLLILALHTQNYTQAGKILQAVGSASQFRFQLENVKERWKIFEAYYFILLKAGVAVPYANARFRFSSFLNGITIHNKDKKGYNASILIVELLFHLLNKEFHIITEKIDAVKRYSKRHFEKTSNYRSYIFLRMMIECEKCEFIKKDVIDRTKKLQKQLAEIQFTYIKSLDGLEVIPFTNLWNIVIASLV
jgi:hypothetical protein